MLKLVTKAVNWKAVTSALFNLVEEAILVIKSDGIHCFVMEPSHVEAIKFFWPKESFTEYELPDGVDHLMNLNVKNVSAAFKRFPSDAPITVSQIENKLSLTGPAKTFACTLFDASEGDKREPQIPYDNSFEIDIAKLEEMMDDCKVIGTHGIMIKKVGDNIVYSGKDVEGTVDGTVVENYQGECEEIGFNFTYMEPVLKAVKVYADPKIKIEIFQKAPIRLNFTIPEVLTIQYYLAPLIEP